MWCRDNDYKGFMEVIDGNWIKERLKGERGEQARLAAAMGIDNDKMSKTLKGLRRVQPDEIPAVLRFFGEDDGVKPERADADSNSPMVPVYDVQASAGFGALIDYEEQTHSLAFPPDYLRKLTGGSVKNLVIISVKGDSMEPTLLDDDIVLVDRSKTHIGYEGMFVLQHNDTLLVKRSGMAARSGFVTLISDNKSYPPIEASLTELKVVGKVLWYGRKV